MRLLWITIGCLSVALGALGAILPLLPTVPFMLLAAFAFSRSSPRLHDWLVQHRVFGPSIRDWRRNRAISRRVKWYASGSIAAAFGLSLALGVGPMVLAIQAVALSLVLLFIWTRREGPRDQPSRESN